MKKMITTLALVLALGFAATTLVGCKGETKTSGTTTQKGDTTGSTEKKTETEEKK